MYAVVVYTRSIELNNQSNSMRTYKESLRVGVRQVVFVVSFALG